MIRLLFIILLLPFFTAAQTVGFKPDTIAYSATDLIAPGRGANTFYNNTQLAAIPDNSNGWSRDNEKRFNWSQLQPLYANTFNFTPIREAFISSISRNQRFSFGIMAIEDGTNTAQVVDGAYCSYPVYVHNQMQSETYKDWKSNGHWVPNWNSNNFLTAFENLLTAIANYIDTASHNGVQFKNVVGRVQIRGFGNWGEWHTAGVGRGSEPTGTKASATSLLRIVDAHIDAFPIFRLQNIINAYCCESYPQVAHYLLTTTNNWGRIGFANDHLGSKASWYPGYAEENVWVYNGDSLKHLIMDQWKVASNNGEPMNSESEVTVSGNVFALMETQIRLYHISQFNNQTHYPSSGSSSLNNLRAASKASGWRIQVDTGSVTRTGSNMSVWLRWSNIGIAPIYENWNVYYQLKSGSTVVWEGASSFQLKLFLPGKSALTNNFTGVPTDDGLTLHVIIKDPTGYRNPLPLYHTTRESNGSYYLATLIGDAPPPTIPEGNRKIKIKVRIN